MQNFIIYTPDFSNYHEISDVTSFKATRYFNGVGKFTLVLPLNEYNNSIIEIYSTVIFRNPDNCFIVCKKTIDTVKGELTVNGFTANWLLHNRIVYSYVTTINSNFTDKSLYDMVNEFKDTLPVITAEPKGLTGGGDRVDIGTYLDDEVVKMIKPLGWGYKFTWDAEKKNFIFDIYKGKDRTENTAFSEERGTAKNLVISEDVTGLYNRFGMQYQVRLLSNGKISDVRGRRTSPLGNPTPTGAEIRDLWFNEINVVDNQGATQITQSLLDLAGGITESKLEERAKDYYKRQNYSVDIEGKDFGTLYDLGDDVTCLSLKYNVKFNKRIEGVEFKLDARGENTHLILGEPNLNIIDLIKLG